MPFAESKFHITQGAESSDIAETHPGVRPKTKALIESTKMTTGKRFAMLLDRPSDEGEPDAPTLSEALASNRRKQLPSEQI